jgi:hypothetical protein
VPPIRNKYSRRTADRGKKLKLPRRPADKKINSAAAPPTDEKNFKFRTAAPDQVIGLHL